MNRYLRFCMITTFYPPYSFGGDGIFVHNLSNELARRGHQVDVIHCVDAYRLLARRQLPGSYHDHPNVTVHGIESHFGPLSPLITQQTGFPLFKSLRVLGILKKGFDVIHYHNISLIGGPKILSYGQGVKLYTMHEYWLVCPTHVLFRSNQAACYEPDCFRCTLSYKRPPQWWRYSSLLKLMLKHVDVFISPSAFCKNKHHQMGLDVPIVHLPSFVPAMQDSSATSKAPTGEVPKRPYFLFVGRLEKLKGLQTIIPIFRNCHKAELLIAGEGSYEPELRHLAAGNANVRFLGRLSGPQLQSLYREAVAVIVPSLCFENFSLVMIEAFRQQTPVIARNLGGMPEIIKESGAGFIYDSDEELVARMHELLANPLYRCELGTRGYQVYRKKWTTEAHLRRYFDLIGEILASSSNRKPLPIPVPGRN
jgi:glycosyltransferase involved in cell wall biosynthesis